MSTTEDGTAATAKPLSYDEELAALRPEYEAAYGEVWDTKQLTEAFTVLSFLAPYVYVRKKEGDVPGTLQFTHRPRFYFNFRPTDQ